MEQAILGIHHVTAIAGDPQQNVDFYTRTLGLRLVKLTVNFDDPGAYHLYYGDGTGRPGSIMTFFSWPGAPKGRQGTGQVAVTSLAIPASSLTYWAERLGAAGISVDGPTARFDEHVLAFRDPDGLALELVARPEEPVWTPWDAAPVPAEHAIRGFHGVTLWEDGYERTARLLVETLGFRPVAEADHLFRYAADSGGPGTFVDVRHAPGFWRGAVAVGTVHHVAWRTPDDAQQVAWRRTLVERGLAVSPVMDRQYFHSIYFREPGGVLFEIATDPPGFAVDEAPEHLGTRLMLPPWMEPHRAELEAVLPALRLPASQLAAEQP